MLSRARGAYKQDEILPGRGLHVRPEPKVVVPFIDRGIPVEYELVRSICTVTQQKRKQLGVLKTDAQLFGGFNPQTHVAHARTGRSSTS